MNHEDTQSRGPDFLVREYSRTQRQDLKDEVIRTCRPIVERAARRFRGIEPHEDLVQVGCIGLLNALEKFDPDAGVKFSTYASHLIVGEIRHYLRDRSQTIRHPAWMQEMRQKVTWASASLQAQLGREPSVEEIAGTAGISNSQVIDVFSAMGTQKVTSLDAAIDDSDGDGEATQFAVCSSRSEHEDSESRMVLGQAIGKLRDLEQQVLLRYHFDSLNQTDIAKELGISGNYVSHILRQSHTKLRAILEGVQRRELAGIAASEEDNTILDPNTGLYSRQYFASRLAEEVHRTKSGGHKVAVILVQFQGLRGAARFYGSQTASDFIRSSADLTRDTLRSLDIVCRADLDMIGAILPLTGESCSIALARLEDRFADWLGTTSAGDSGIFPAYGSAWAPEKGVTAEDLVRSAQPVEEITERAA
jgi:RNA polymerase sigma-B factor